MEKLSEQELEEIKHALSEDPDTFCEKEDHSENLMLQGPLLDLGNSSL